MTQTAGPTVLYLAGSGRSGSTLLERILGAIPGFVNVGELVDLFRQVYPNNELCGCGMPFLDCPFWSDVGELAFGGWTTDGVAQIAGLQGRVARQRHVPRYLTSHTGPAFRRDAAEYRRQYDRLYRAIAEVSGAHTIVDASKWPAQTLALSRGVIDLRVVHMIRDVRGVVWSVSKRAVERPHVTNGSDRMFSTSMLGATGTWALCQEEVALLGRRRTPLSVLRYEDLVSDARGQVTRILGELDLPVSADELSHLRNDHAILEPSHGLAGNPSRFHGGTTQLRLDNEWRTRMPRIQQAALASVQATASWRPQARRRTGAGTGGRGVGERL